MNREELRYWAESHATGPMVSPVAVAVLELLEELEEKSLPQKESHHELGEAGA